MLELLDPVRFTRTDELKPAEKDRVKQVVVRRLILSSFVYDWQLRKRIAGTNVNQFFLLESAVPSQDQSSAMLALASISAAAPSWNVADAWLRLANVSARLTNHAIQRRWAIRRAKRLEAVVATNAMAFAILGANDADVRTILAECDFPLETLRSQYRELDLVGFWRVDKKMLPEHRTTVLTLVAFADLQSRIAACGGDLNAGIEAFCDQNDGEGWMLPETLRLADFGLGHDGRAREHQPVRDHFGPRFYDWQLAQSPEDSWRECRLHARNLLGAEGFAALIDELEGRTPEQEAEEERLNELWDDLDDAQHQRLWGLSADLNTLRDNEVVIASDWPPMSEEALGEALQSALDKQQWDQALELLRRPPHVLPRDERDALRGNCWASLGHQDVAALFADNAVRLKNAAAGQQKGAINPTVYTEKIVRSFLKYQLSAYPFADARLHGQMRELLSVDKVRRTPLLRGPYISLSRGFRAGATVAKLIADGVFHSHMRQIIPAAITNVYGHQERAVRAVHAGQTTLVSTGTGSGKTECFLYPIISKCLQLKDSAAPAGISAVIVYPMNALAEDQLDRLRGLLAGSGISFGMYVGKTPGHEREVAGHRMPAGSSRADYEAVLSR